jgi:subtilisin family serine protease
MIRTLTLATLHLVLTLSLALPAHGWIWDRNANRIDDRIEKTATTGLAAAFENGDLTARPIIAIVSDAGVLRYGVYVGYAAQPGEAELAALRASGVSTTVFYPFRTIPYVQMALTWPEIETVAALPGVERVEAVEMMYAFNNVATKTSGVTPSQFRRFPTVHENLGITGRNIVVGVLDTGVNDAPDALTGFPGHESFAGKYVAGGNFYSGQPALNTGADQSENPVDRGVDSVHGSHVAGTVMGTGGASRVFGGVAPDSLLVDLKVLSDAGAGFGSAAGVEWAILNKDRYDIRVLNLSLGGLTESDGTDAGSRAINAAFDAGIISVVAMGNDSATNYVPSPAAADKAFSIGSIADQNTIDRSDDLISSFSNEGPRKSDGDDDFEDEMKPLVAAPGSGIVSADGSLLTDGRQYKSLSGTSMATPHVAGIVALILEANPSLTPAAVKEILKHTSEHRRDWGKTPASSTPFPQGDPNYHPSGGWGQVDGYAAVKEALRLKGDPASQTQVIHIHAARAADGTSAIDLQWTTQREINLAGFDIWRASDAGGRPGTFVQLNGSRIAGSGSPVIERTSNRNHYSFRDGGNLQDGSIYWYRITHTSNDAAVGTIEEPAIAVTYGTPRPVARISYSITHNAIDNDLMVLIGTGTQAERARWIIDGKSALQADQVIVEPGEATTGNRRHEFSIDLTSLDDVEAFLPPSKTNPWFLSVKEGGYINRTGRVNSFSITLFDENGNPTQTFATGDPTPQQLVEDQTTRLWIPDDPNVWMPGDRPSLVEVTPATASAGSENLVVDFFGAEFLPNATISFSGDGIIVHGQQLIGGVALDSGYQSGSQLRATLSVAAGASAGPRDVTVTNPDGAAGTLAGGFTVTGSGSGGECTSLSTSIDDSDPAVASTGGWHQKKSSTASNGSYLWKMAAGNQAEPATVKVVFTGNQITYHFAREHKGGTADLYIDGSPAGSVSFAGTTKQPEFGHSVTLSDLAEGTHELLIVLRSGAGYVDGFDISSCQMASADAGAVSSRSVSSVSSATLGLAATTLLRTIEIGATDQVLSVLVESDRAVSVNIIDPAGTLLATGGSLLSGGGVSGADSRVTLPGLYTVQIVDSGALSSQNVTISIAREVRID